MRSHHVHQDYHAKEVPPHETKAQTTKEGCQVHQKDPEECGRATIWTGKKKTDLAP
eukprot:GDKH01028953.1.p4 GENE.GDKH01028953.1~~GDKH01028953.1.p4  ORF type:complete len:56 (-),score=3.00 GDKH01028953.1:262-429(-)